ncbi:GMC oxidoreductase-domain-containing protein [Lentinula edodes]|nr:GMC oxidoreductase-domain-containing protein [Lentinula edodes]
MPLVSIEQVAGHIFDYIVAAYTAGLTLASRLSENADWSVLVLEAGNEHLDSENHPLITRPGQFGMQIGNPEYDWGFKTVPQKFSDNNEYLWSRGKGLGGTSAMNFSVWTFPPKEDIDNWEKLGNPGWNWANFEKHTTRAITYTPLESTTTSLSVEAFNVWDANKPHGEGPLQVAHPRGVLDTLLNMGFIQSRAPYHGDSHGCYFALNNVHPTLHSRTYAATASQDNAFQRQNLSVLVGAEVTVILSSDSKDDDFEASGVEFLHKATNRKFCALSRKEVILSAGSLKSPQILELSGIGKQEILSRLGIDVKVPLEGVGENLQEHLFIGCTFELKEDYTGETYDLLRDSVQQSEHVDLYSKGQGIYMTGIVNMASFPLKKIASDAEALYDAEKIRIHQDIKEGRYPPGLAEQYELQLQYHQHDALDCEFVSLSGSLSGPNLPRPEKKYYTIIGFLNHNFSRGTIHSSSSNPYDPPLMDPHYFEHDIDLQAFINEVKYIRKIVKTVPLKDVLSDVELNPGADIQTDEQIASWLKQNLSTGWHTVGTLSMLPKDRNGAVDSKLKVYGTKNIRVVDLSVVPLQIAAHTQATAYIIAEQVGVDLWVTSIKSSNSDVEHIGNVDANITIFDDVGYPAWAACSPWNAQNLAQERIKGLSDTEHLVHESTHLSDGKVRAPRVDRRIGGLQIADGDIELSSDGLTDVSLLDGVVTSAGGILSENIEARVYKM